MIGMEMARKDKEGLPCRELRESSLKIIKQNQRHFQSFNLKNEL